MLADVAAQVDRGARHVTFGDPDFFNGVHHARRVVDALHARFPDVTFDCTVKVEHVLRHADALARARRERVPLRGECVRVRRRRDPRPILDKGHTARDETARRRRLLRAAGIEPRPTWLPVHAVVARSTASAASSTSSPTTTSIGNVDPVQYSIRLLVPEGSLLLGHLPELGPWDPARLGYQWTSPLDELQREFAAVVEARADDPVADVFNALRGAGRPAAGRRASRRGGAPAQRVVVLLRGADDRAAPHRLTRRPGSRRPRAVRAPGAGHRDALVGRPPAVVG